MFQIKCQPYIFEDKKFVIDEGGELKEVLSDFSSSGRENPHSNNKRMTNYLSLVYRNISRLSEDHQFLDFPVDDYKMIQKANKLNYCSNYLEFAHLKDNTKRISYIESCHKSLCPICNFFRARFNLSSFVDVLSRFFSSGRYVGYPFLFLTLTVTSCYGEDLPALLDKMSRSWNKLINTKEFKRAFVAASRSLEITINRDPESKSYMMFHPHYHVILVARPDYFSKLSDLYLDNLHFLWLWQRSFGNHTFRSFDKWLSWYSSFFDDFGSSVSRLLPSAPKDLITQIDVRRIKVNVDPDKAIHNILGALNELLKYPFKPDELLTGNLDEDTEVVFFMDKAMQHRRRWNLTGIFKDIAAELSIPEDDPDELVQTAGLDPDEVDYFSAWWFSGKFGEYLRGKKKTVEQKNAVRRFLGLPLLDPLSQK